MLANTVKNSPNTMGDTFGIDFPENDEKHDQGALMEICKVFGTLSHVDCQCVF